VVCRCEGSKETADIYKTQNRADLAEAELLQANVIEAYLPKQMDEAEIKAEITKILALPPNTYTKHPNLYHPSSNLENYCPGNRNTCP